MKTFTTKHQQEELQEFFAERIKNENLAVKVKGQIFEDILLKSRSFIEISILMRDEYKVFRRQTTLM